MLFGGLLLKALLIWLGLVLIAVLIGLVQRSINGGSDGDYYPLSSSPDEPADSSTWRHENYWGIETGRSEINKDTGENYNYWNGLEGSFDIHGDTIQHRTWYGEYDGTSEICDGGKRLNHYTELGHVYTGCSEISDDGRTITHYNEWGIETGRSVREN